MTDNEAKAVGYGRAWVWFGLGYLLTRGMGAPPPPKPMPMGYGGAWVGGLGWGHGFGLAIESPPCHLTSPPHTRLQTHANGATPQPKPPEWWLGRFQPTQAPYPMV
ncbi:hypothetical protein HanXRQr2_Chr07g0310671 [Helianthus annuus]|nr:hypothetical protein HanXRQr2_Chr07g0310671 [Helianthus annuus]